MSTPSTHSTKNNAPLERGSVRATSQKHGLNHNAVDAEGKYFSALKARYSQAGHTFYRTVNPDGTVIYLASRWGLTRELKTLEAASAFLIFIGGSL